MTSLRIEPGAKIVFAGDSITDTEYRTRAQPLGYGFVMFFSSLIDAQRPGLGLRIQNRGNDGDTIVDLERRWDSEVLAEAPDWLFVMIGTNDVFNRHIPDRVPFAVDDATYERTARSLVERTRQLRPATRIVWVEPPPFEWPLDSDPQRELAAICRILARVRDDSGCELVLVRDAMAEALARGQTAGWFQNVNHPYFTGHAAVALALLRHVGWRHPEVG